MSVQIPKTMRALIQKNTDTERSAVIEEVPVPQLSDNEVLIKINYVAQNPTDWKHREFLSPSGAIHGGDFAGTVVQLGPNLKVPLKLGDKIAGCTQGGNVPDRGTYAQYTRIESDFAFKIPQGITEEQAATYGIAWVTACQSIVYSQKHAFPPAKVAGNPWYIVYGGSTSVGLFAIPLAKALGFRVLAVASSRSFDLVKSYGADVVVDYHDSDVVEKGLKFTGGGTEYALDTISLGDSLKITIGLMGEKGKQLNVIVMVPEDVKAINPKVEIVFTLMYTLFGRELNFTPPGSGPMTIPPLEHDYAFGKEIYARTPELISEYGVKPNPVTIRGGLDDVLTGFEEMKAGKISGTKYVYKIE